MTPARTSIDFLEDILNAARTARRFVELWTREQFLADERTQFAVVRALEILGEATKRMPSSEFGIRKCRGDQWLEYATN